jgi:hypothetical protein
MNSKVKLTILLLSLLMPFLLCAQNETENTNYYNPTKEEQKNNDKQVEKKYKNLPSCFFMTFHAGVQGDYGHQQFFVFKTPTFGFKIGTMKNTGWFLGMMTNFNYKGAFNTFKNVESLSKTSYTYIEGTLGLTGRYCKPLSFHFGVGYFCQAMNQKNENDIWGHYPENVKHGPMVTAGFMFHIRKFVLSVEVSGNYNIAFISESTGFEYNRVGLGAKAGLGFCLPRKQYHNKKKQKGEGNSGRDVLEGGIGRDLREQRPM